jgi:hypothetical protein
MCFSPQKNKLENALNLNFLGQVNKIRNTFFRRKGTEKGASSGSGIGFVSDQFKTNSNFLKVFLFV